MTLKKVIVALDFSSQKDLWTFVDKLDPKLCMVKVGSQLFINFGHEVINKLQSLGFAIFLDLKFYDIPNTVANACKAAADLGVQMLTLHTSGGLEMLLAAKEALFAYQEKPLLLGVTVLTSMSEEAYRKVDIYKNNIQDSVELLTALASEAGLDGVVSSAFEVPLVKKHNLLAVTPGIRLSNDNWGDQKRVVTPLEAFKLGSDYIVMGRDLHEAIDPMKIIKEFCA
ncbi:MAG: orotidine-5'-phosphate decarboxylase [Chlamydiae bacterium]|nr:orotidine-5'-phosphate decarboxylase [Chlamydiota bacterium]